MHEVLQSLQNFMEFLDSCFLSIDKKIRGTLREEYKGMSSRGRGVESGNISRETAKGEQLTTG